MEKKEFSKFFIASLKRTAQNVQPLVRRKTKLLNQIEEMREELCSLQAQIDGYQIPIKEVTGGYTTEDLVKRVITETPKLDKDGKPVKMTQYVLKYPDTVIPMEEKRSDLGEHLIEQPSVEDTPTAPSNETADDDLPFSDTMADPMPDSEPSGEIIIN